MSEQMRKWKKERRVGVDLGTKAKRKVSGRMGMSDVMNYHVTRFAWSAILSRETQ